MNKIIEYIKQIFTNKESTSSSKQFSSANIKASPKKFNQICLVLIEDLKNESSVESFSKVLLSLLELCRKKGNISLLSEIIPNLYKLYRAQKEIFEKEVRLKDEPAGYSRPSERQEYQNKLAIWKGVFLNRAKEFSNLKPNMELGLTIEKAEAILLDILISIDKNDRCVTNYGGKQAHPWLLREAAEGLLVKSVGRTNVPEPYSNNELIVGRCILLLRCIKNYSGFEVEIPEGSGETTLKKTP